MPEKPHTSYVFEVAFEVCNKVGGIYTVIKSKIAKMQRYYRENYVLIGPFVPEQAAIEFQKRSPPKRLRELLDSIEKDTGIVCHYGKWLVEGKPSVILIDYSSFMKKRNEIKTGLWNDYAVDSLFAGNDFDEPVVWSTAAGMLIERLIDEYKDEKAVAHFHEWLSGGGLLYLKRRKVNVGLVFTTHATVLGRTLAGNGVDLYSKLDSLKPYEEAKKFKVQAKHTIEKACAQNADVFTTVSGITGLEAEKILGRKPDVLLPNGLDIEKFPSMEEATLLHREFRGKIKHFLAPYFFPYYTFDLDNILVYFIAGRYEFHNKGVDLFIEALGKLNRELKNKNSKKTIVAFIWTPRATNGVNISLLENLALYEDMEESVDDLIPDMREKMLYSLASGEIPNMREIVPNEFLGESKKKIITFKKKGDPPLCAFSLEDEQNDPIIRALVKNGLHNREEDKVKVIFYPTYLSSADRLLDISYEHAIMGCHLGVFPSYYEPWGYTPLETAAYGVPSVTTDLTGFGSFIDSHSDQRKKPGIFVLERRDRSWERVVNDLYKVMLWFTTLSKKDRVKKKMAGKRLAALADWRILVQNYIKAHNMAVSRLSSRLHQSLS
jgi:glycogen(starch) synthase